MSVAAGAPTAESRTASLASAIAGDGMRSFFEFMRGVRNLAGPIQAWIVALGAINLVGGAVYVGRPEGQATLTAFAVAFAIMLLVVRARGFVRLLGIGHLVAWTPLLIWLATRVDVVPSEGGMRGWIFGLFVMNGASLVIDLVDVIRYARGERSPIA